MSIPANAPAFGACSITSAQWPLYGFCSIGFTGSPTAAQTCAVIISTPVAYRSISHKRFPPPLGVASMIYAFPSVAIRVSILNTLVCICSKSISRCSSDVKYASCSGNVLGHVNADGAYGLAASASNRCALKLTNRHLPSCRKLSVSELHPTFSKYCSTIILPFIDLANASSSAAL